MAEQPIMDESGEASLHPRNGLSLDGGGYEGWSDQIWHGGIPEVQPGQHLTGESDGC